MKLSIEEIDALPVPPRPKKAHDGRGLFLLLQPDGARYWRQNYSLAGSRKTLSLGVYPAVGLDEAREESRRLLAIVKAGGDPSAIRKEARQTAKAEARAAAQRLPARFMIDQSGGLIVHLPKRRFELSREEVVELRVFLAATQNVGGVGDG